MLVVTHFVFRAKLSLLKLVNNEEMLITVNLKKKEFVLGVKGHEILIRFIVLSVW